MRIRIFLRLLLLLMAAGATFLAFWLWWLDYEEATRRILAYLGRESWGDYWRERVMPPQRYELLRWLAAAGSATLWLLMPIFWRVVDRKVPQWSAEWALWREKLRQWRREWSAESAAVRWSMYAMTFVFVARTVFNWWWWELQYDEAWTYLHFVQQGAVVSAVSPHNNHILYTVLASWADWLHFLGDKYALRLPLLLGGAALWLAWALLWWRWRGGMRAVAMSAAMLGASVLMLYMVYARGYVFLLAALAGQLGAGLWWWRSVGLASEALARRAWWLAAVVGLYAMPTYAYYYILLAMVWLAAAAWGRCWRLMGAAWWWVQVKVALVVGILYLPFAIAGGLGVLWRAAAEGDGAGRWAWYDKWADWLLWGVDWRYTSLALVAMALAALYAARCWGLKSGGAWLGLSLAGLLLMPLLIGAGQPLRVFAPSVLTWVAAMGVGIWWLRRWGVVVAVGLWLAAYAHYELRWSAPLDRTAVAISALLCRENVQEIYCFSRYDKPLLEYYGLRRCAGRQWRLYLPFEDSRDYLPLDSRPHYEAVLLDIDDYAPTSADWAHVQQTGYKLVYADYRLRLYVWEE